MTQKKKKHHSRPHFDSNFIKSHMLTISREARMATLSPETVTKILGCYILLKNEGWKAARLQKMLKIFDEKIVKYCDGELDMDAIRKQVREKAEFEVEHKDYTESDIKNKKGTFFYTSDKMQLESYNTMNRTATDYMIMFYSVLVDLGLSKNKINAIADAYDVETERYRENRKATVDEWQDFLFNEVGMVFQSPQDPLTKGYGSSMVGDTAYTKGAMANG